MKKFDVTCIANTDETLRIIVKAKNEEMAANKVRQQYNITKVIGIIEKGKPVLHMFNEMAFRRDMLEA